LDLHSKKKKRKGKKKVYRARSQEKTMKWKRNSIYILLFAVIN
jgi:hypothetical protein